MGSRLASPVLAQKSVLQEPEVSLGTEADLFPVGGQGSGVSFLDAQHESRRRQAVRAIDNYRHLLGQAEADEIRCAIEEFTRERLSIRSLSVPGNPLLVDIAADEARP
jgi:hypothetical protein